MGVLPVRSRQHGHLDAPHQRHERHGAQGEERQLPAVDERDDDGDEDGDKLVDHGADAQTSRLWFRRQKRLCRASI